MSNKEATGKPVRRYPHLRMQGRPETLDMLSRPDDHLRYEVPQARQKGVQRPRSARLRLEQIWRKAHGIMKSVYRRSRAVAVAFIRLLSA